MIDFAALNTSFLPALMTGNPIIHNIEPADPVVVADRSSLRYALAIDVPETPGSTTWRELAVLDGSEKPPVTSGGSTIYEGAFFQIDRLLDGFLKRGKPQPAQRAITAVSTLTMPFRLREKITGGVPAQNIERTTAATWCVKAGLAPIDAEAWGTGFFDVYQQTVRRFLTNQPDNKTISLDDEEYLYFLLNISPLPNQVRLRIEMNSPKGVVPNNLEGVKEITALTLSNPAPYSVLCVPISPRLFVKSNVLTNFRVWLANEKNEAISEVRTYWIDTRQRAATSTLLFNNSLGGYDCLRLLGDQSSSTSVSRTAGERGNGEAFVVNSSGSQTLTIATGLVEREGEATLAWWNELLLAEEWYLVDSKGHIPLILQTDSLSGMGGQGGLVSATFQFKAAQATNYHSNLPVAPTTAKRATGWRGVGFRHVLDAVGKRTGLGMPLKLRLYYLDTNLDVKPLQEKPNTPGSDYIAPTPVPGVVPGTTPFPSAELIRLGTFKRSDCSGGQEGSPATIVVGAGAYGGESQEDADALAEAQYKLLDTQEYANANGSCSLSESYEWNVPAGQWHIRMSAPSSLAVYHHDGSGGNVNMGNVQSLAPFIGQNGQTFIYPSSTRDMDFPVGDANWNFYAFGQAGATGTVTIYQNGASLGSQTFSFNSDGYELFSLTARGGTTTTPGAFDRWFIRLSLNA